MLAGIIFGVLVLAIAYLWHMNRAISTAPAEATNVTQSPWTAEDFKNAYEKAQDSPVDVKPFLFSKKDRRYIVVGGSGK